jgi:hypothetical protein
MSSQVKSSIESESIQSFHLDLRDYNQTRERDNNRKLANTYHSDTPRLWMPTSVIPTSHFYHHRYTTVFPPTNSSQQGLITMSLPPVSVTSSRPGAPDHKQQNFLKSEGLSLAGNTASVYAEKGAKAYADSVILKTKVPGSWNAENLQQDLPFALGLRRHMAKLLIGQALVIGGGYVIAKLRKARAVSAVEADPVIWTTLDDVTLQQYCDWPSGSAADEHASPVVPALSPRSHGPPSSSYSPALDKYEDGGHAAANSSESEICEPAAIVPVAAPLPIPSPPCQQVREVEEGVDAPVMSVEPGTAWNHVEPHHDGGNSSAGTIGGESSKFSERHFSAVQARLDKANSMIPPPPPPPPLPSRRSPAAKALEALHITPGPLPTEMANLLLSMVSPTEMANPLLSMVSPTEMANPLLGMASPTEMANPLLTMVSPTEMANPILTMVSPTEMANPLLSMVSPTVVVPSASQSVRSVQAEQNIEQFLQKSMLQNELEELRKMADLFKSQRDDALGALHKQANEFAKSVPSSKGKAPQVDE